MDTPSAKVVYAAFPVMASSLTFRFVSLRQFG
jgi:hypothetical protein